MFVFSVKTSVKQLIRMGFGCAIVLTALLLMLCLPTPHSTVRGDTEEQRVDYLASLGYTADPASVEVREMTLPDVFDAVMQGYNQLQQTAGMDLSPYRNRIVKRYTYAVTTPRYRYGGGDVAGMRRQGHRRRCSGCQGRRFHSRVDTCLPKMIP